MTRNGADLLIETAETQGLSTCFANPGTTELHLVDALARAATMRTILTLFEGVASGAADGFARMARIPALGLFHLGPGYANSLANQHNARRHESPMINLIGDHATWHRHADAPLHSDIAALTGWSGTTHPVVRAEEAGTVMQEAYRAAVGPDGGTGRTASIVFPTDAAWDATNASVPAPLAPIEPAAPHEDVVESVANVLRRPGAAIVAGGAFLSADSIRALKAIEQATGCAVHLSRVARLEIGRHLPGYDELPYFPEPLRSALAGTSDAVLVGRSEPVTFFGYPNQPSSALPEDCRRHTLAGAGADAEAALQALARFLGVEPDSAPPAAAENIASFEAFRTLAGPLTARTIGAVFATAIPEDGIVVGEAITSGAGYRAAAPFASPHTLLSTSEARSVVGYRRPLEPRSLVPNARCFAFKLMAARSTRSSRFGLWRGNS